MERLLPQAILSCTRAMSFVKKTVGFSLPPYMCHTLLVKTTHSLLRFAVKLLQLYFSGISCVTLERKLDGVGVAGELRRNSGSGRCSPRFGDFLRD